jgi:hypothetical protein
MHGARATTVDSGTAKGSWSEIFRNGLGLYSALVIGGIAMNATQMLVIAIIMPTIEPSAMPESTVVARAMHRREIPEDACRSIANFCASAARLYRAACLARQKHRRKRDVNRPSPVISVNSGAPTARGLTPAATRARQAICHGVFGAQPGTTRIWRTTYHRLKSCPSPDITTISNMTRTGH